MAITTGRPNPQTVLASPAIGRLPVTEPLQVTGTLPAELSGCLVQTTPHPISGRSTFSGVRLDGGRAGWYRSRRTVHRSRPFGPVPALAQSLWPTDPAEADQPGGFAAARPVREPGAPLWHTVATYPELGQAEHLVLDEEGQVLRSEQFTLDGAPLLQAVAVTARYLVVLDLPVTYRRAAAMIGARLPYAWQPGRAARIGLLPLRSCGGMVPIWFDIDPCYVFHTINAFEESSASGPKVVLDAVRHPSAFDGRSDGEPPCLYRWTLRPGAGTVRGRRLTGGVRSAALTGLPAEVAIVDGRVRGSAHRHVFATAAGPDGAVLARHDVRTGRSRIRRLGPATSAGQPVFVPRGDAEGDGWLLVLVTDAVAGRTELLVLDAAELTGPPVAVVTMPVRVPVGQRAEWLRDG